MILPNSWLLHKHIPHPPRLRVPLGTWNWRR
uniref:Uncharacterized protein n=1 Tax=Rhizophora mucronata TaxID=61149 RepID=A0A2P2PU20_RHIMU